MINNILIDISDNSIFLISSIAAVILLSFIFYVTRKTQTVSILLFESKRNILRLSLLFTKILFMVRIMLFTDNINLSFVFAIIIMDAIYNVVSLRLPSVLFDYGTTLLFVLIKAVSIAVIQFSELNENSWVQIVAYIFTYSYLGMQIIFILLTKLSDIKRVIKSEHSEEEKETEYEKGYEEEEYEEATRDTNRM